MRACAFERPPSHTAGLQEVGVRLVERAAQGLTDGVKSYTGKESRTPTRT